MTSHIKDALTNLDFILIFLCLKEPRCSKEIASILGNPHNDRNLQKSLNRLVNTGFLKYADFQSPKYPKSKFFIVDDIEVVGTHSIEDLFSVSHESKNGKSSLYLKSNIGIKSKKREVLIEAQVYKRIRCNLVLKE